MGKELMIEQAGMGDIVQVHYVGKLEDGSVVLSTDEDKPVEFTVGEGQVVQGLEEAVIGMSPGEVKTVEVPADKAYGDYHEELIREVDESYFPEDLDPEVGMEVGIRLVNGKTIEASVTGISGTLVTLDANRPLAGEDLVFDVELVGII